MTRSVDSPPGGVRAVLRRGTGTELTRVDILLAFGVGALVALGLAKYAKEIWGAG